MIDEEPRQTFPIDLTYGCQSCFVIRHSPGRQPKHAKNSFLSLRIFGAMEQLDFQAYEVEAHAEVPAQNQL